MKRQLPILLVTLFLLSATADAQFGRRGRARGARWAPDGRNLVVSGAWRDPLTWKKVAPGDKPAVKAGDALRRIFKNALGKARGGEVPAGAFRGRPVRSTLPRAPENSPGVRISKDASTAAVILDGELWVYRRGIRGPKRMATALEGVRRFEIAPGGGAVSFIKDNDLHVVRLGDGRTFKLTDDGGENVFNGELDWVYQEEVYGRGNFKATWWAPGDENLAFMRIDEEGVDTFTVVDHIPQRLKIEHIKYPKAGTTNPRATLHLGRSADGSRVAVDLSKYRPEDEILIIYVGWTPAGDELVFQVQNREQTWLDLNFADPKSGKVRTVIHESCDDGWVNRLAMPRWLKDGSFVWESERTGFKHLYRYDPSGKLLATLTRGDWEVGRIVRLDEERGHVTFMGTKDGAVGRNAYRVGLDGQGFVRLTKGRGSHSISLNEDGSLLVDRFSSLASPPETWLRKADGSDVRRIGEAPEIPAGNLPELHQIKARDGETLDVVVTKPRKFDPTKAYPVWISTYSGPDTPTVSDSWRGMRGMPDTVSFQVNVRSASGRGMKYTKRCYRQLGVQELRDLEDAVRWLTEKPWADGGRVGITGGSYGGFMTAFALTHSKLFKVGIAVSGVYDWKLYDTIYTERYMATPQNNPEGYAKTSVVEAAKNLSGRLLVIHGTMDDNVHMQNAVQFIYELQRANKDFDFMLYPRSRHGIRGRHVGRLRQQFIAENL